MLGFGALGQFALGEGPSASGNAWLPPWSEPVRARIAPALAIALIAAGEFVSFNTITSEAISADKWFAPLSPPVRVKPRLTAAPQQSAPPHPFAPLPREPGTPDPPPLPPPPPGRPLPLTVVQGGGTSRRLERPARIARGLAPEPRRPVRRDPPRQVEPEKKAPTFAEFLRNWRPPPFAADPALERKRVTDQQPFVGPAPSPLPDFSHLDRLLAHAADEHDATRAVERLLDAEEGEERQNQLFGRRE